MALGIGLLLAFLGAGLGASSINPLQERNPLEGLRAGAIIWMIIIGFVSFFAGGWVAAFGSGVTATRTEALIHAAVTWAIVSIFSVSLITGAAGSVLSGAASFVGQTVSGGAQAATQSPELSERIRQALEERGINVQSLQQQAQSPEAQAKAEEMARQAGAAVAKGISRAALGAFGMLLLDLFASLFGAWAAARRGLGGVTTAAERVA